MVPTGHLHDMALPEPGPASGHPRGPSAQGPTAPDAVSGAGQG